MSSMIGNRLKLSVFGESHGPAIGVVLDGLPPGEKLEMERIQLDMSRRAPGSDVSTTRRVEKDVPEILSGLKENITTGAPLCGIFRNTNTRPGDYDDFKVTPRPSHADFPAGVRFRGYQDISGSGHFSGRLTAPLVFAGAVCRQVLERRGIIIGGHILQVGDVYDQPFDMCGVNAEQLNRLNKLSFAVVDPQAEQHMRESIEKVRMEADSIGGVLEVAAVGIQPGIGSPIFEGCENVLSGLIFGIPAVKGVEFGTGFQYASMRGSEANDAYLYDEYKNLKTKTNHTGGIAGGITTGMPLIVRAAVKPTPSIGITQKTVNLSTKENTVVQVRGRHDPCVAVRALSCVEAAVAVGLLNLWLGSASI